MHRFVNSDVGIKYSATQRLTGNPVYCRLVSSHLLGHGIRNLKRRRSINFAAPDIQHLFFLLVHMIDLDETIGFVLGVGVLVAEFLYGLFEMHDFAI